MTFSAYIVFAIVLFLAMQYNKLIDRERMYKEYYDWSLEYMQEHGADPAKTLFMLCERLPKGVHDETAKAAIEDAFVHYFRCRGVIIENLKIYWNE